MVLLLLFVYAQTVSGGAVWHIEKSSISTRERRKEVATGMFATWIERVANRGMQRVLMCLKRSLVFLITRQLLDAMMQ